MNDRLHCIAKKHDGYWSARCLDFSLYATGDTLAEAKQKLATEIDDYLFDAIEGDEQQNAAHLLLRRADYQEWLLFYLLRFIANCQTVKNKIGEAFDMAVPNGPFHQHYA